MHSIMEYERPMKPFFIEIPNFWAGADKLGSKFWGIFSQTIISHFVLCCESLVHVYHYSIIISTILYIQIPNIYLGFEFGPQRIRDLAIVCP